MGFRNLIALLTASALVMPLIAVTDEEEGVVEEIVVTASHRQSTLMESPQSITAITCNRLE